MKKIGIVAAFKRESVDLINRVAFDYVASVETAGALPFIIPCNGTANLDAYFDLADALVIPGGHDVDPALYGQPLAGSKGVERGDDDFLAAVLRRAAERKMPTLGICRGLQMMNVAAGGDLIQHLPNADAHDQWQRQYEAVDFALVAEGSFLEKAFGTRRIAINSLHHQAAGKVGAEYSVAARSELDGTVEALEHASLPFYGTQWHPECLKDHGALFRWFVQGAAEHR